MIEVRRTSEGDPLEFEVVVREGQGKTRHRVTMAQDRFLLDREPKESILSRFDVTVISRYFPEFERELPRYLSQS